MLSRTLEPEIMDTMEDAMEYDAMDHTKVNEVFVTDLLAAGPLGRDVLDIGTGTALIPVELCRRNTEVRVMASDAAGSMLDIARYNLELHRMTHRIQLHLGDAKKLVFQDNYFDTVYRTVSCITCPTPGRFSPRLFEWFDLAASCFSATSIGRERSGSRTTRTTYARQRYRLLQTTASTKPARRVNTARGVAQMVAAAEATRTR